VTSQEQSAGVIAGKSRSMKPTLLQRIFATVWPIRVWCALFCLAAPLDVFVYSEVTWEWFWRWKSLLLAVVMLAVSLPIGFYIGAFTAGFLLSPLYCLMGWWNGAPFAIGDTVQIIGGKHRGKVARVYAMWQGDSVRVRLGDTEESCFSDVFVPSQLLRVRDTENLSLVIASAEAGGEGSRASGSGGTAGDSGSRGNR